MIGASAMKELKLTWFSNVLERKMLIDTLEHAEIGRIRHFQIFKVLLTHV